MSWGLADDVPLDWEGQQSIEGTIAENSDGDLLFVVDEIQVALLPDGLRQPDVCVPWETPVSSSDDAETSRRSASALNQLRALEPNPEDALLMFTAVEISLAECIQARGHDYVPEPPTLEDLLASEAFVQLETSIPVVLVDGEGSGSYRLKTTLANFIAPRPSDSRNSQVRSSLNEADEAAHSADFTGVDGCLSFAERRLLGDFEYSDFLSVESDRQEIISRLRQAFVFGEQIAPQLEQWDACMTANGFPDLFSPNAVVLDLVERYSVGDETQASQYEVEVATADAACRDEIDFDDRADARNEAYGQALLAEFEQAVERIRQINSLMIREASAIINRQ